MKTEVNEFGMCAALSYCLETTRTFMTTLASLQARNTGSESIDLPNTCHGAVVVAKAFGIPYIWNDSLCIMRDSKEDLERRPP